MKGFFSRLQDSQARPSKPTTSKKFWSSSKHEPEVDRPKPTTERVQLLPTFTSNTADKQPTNTRSRHPQPPLLDDNGRKGNSPPEDWPQHNPPPRSAVPYSSSIAPSHTFPRSWSRNQNPVPPDPEQHPPTAEKTLGLRTRSSAYGYRTAESIRPLNDHRPPTKPTQKDGNVHGGYHTDYPKPLTRTRDKPRDADDPRARYANVNATRPPEREQLRPRDTELLRDRLAGPPSAYHTDGEFISDANRHRDRVRQAPDIYTRHKNDVDRSKPTNEQGDERVREQERQQRELEKWREQERERERRRTERDERRKEAEREQQRLEKERQRQERKEELEVERKRQEEAELERQKQEFETQAKEREREVQRREREAAWMRERERRKLEEAEARKREEELEMERKRQEDQERRRQWELQAERKRSEEAAEAERRRQEDVERERLRQERDAEMERKRLEDIERDRRRREREKERELIMERRRLEELERERQKQEWEAEMERKRQEEAHRQREKEIAEVELKREEEERRRREEEREAADLLQRQRREWAVEMHRRQQEEEARRKEKEAADLERKRQDEERQRREKERTEAERKKREEEHEIKRREEERQRWAMEMEYRRREEERVKREAELEAKRQEEERLRREAEMESKRRDEERLKWQEAFEAKHREEERLRREEALEARRREEERLKREEALEARRREEERLKLAEALEARRREDERLKQEKALEARRQEEERLKQEEAQEARRREEERLKRDAEVETKRREEELLRREEAVEARRREQERSRREAEFQARQREEQEEEERKQAESELKRQEEDRLRRQKEAAQLERMRQEEQRQRDIELELQRRDEERQHREAELEFRRRVEEHQRREADLEIKRQEIERQRRAKEAAAEAERKRREEEQLRREKEAADAELKRREEEHLQKEKEAAELARRTQEEENRRREKEELEQEARRRREREKEAEIERQHREWEAEVNRQRQLEERRRHEEAIAMERKRQEDEAEALEQKRQAEAEQRRREWEAAEVERKRRQDLERERLKAEWDARLEHRRQEEQQRREREAETERMRLAEVERQRLEEESFRREREEAERERQRLEREREAAAAAAERKRQEDAEIELQRLEEEKRKIKAAELELQNRRLQEMAREYERRAQEQADRQRQEREAADEMERKRLENERERLRQERDAAVERRRLEEENQRRAAQELERKAVADAEREGERTRREREAEIERQRLEEVERQKRQREITRKEEAEREQRLKDYEAEMERRRRRTEEEEREQRRKDRQLEAERRRQEEEAQARQEQQREEEQWRENDFQAEHDRRRQDALELDAERDRPRRRVAADKEAELEVERQRLDETPQWRSDNVEQDRQRRYESDRRRLEEETHRRDSDKERESGRRDKERRELRRLQLEKERERIRISREELTREKQGEHDSEREGRELAGERSRNDRQPQHEVHTREHRKLQERRDKETTRHRRRPQRRPSKELDPPAIRHRRSADNDRNMSRNQDVPAPDLMVQTKDHPRSSPLAAATDLRGGLPDSSEIPTYPEPVKVVKADAFSSNQLPHPTIYGHLTAQTQPSGTLPDGRSSSNLLPANDSPPFKSHLVPPTPQPQKHRLSPDSRPALPTTDPAIDTNRRSREVVSQKRHDESGQPSSYTQVEPGVEGVAAYRTAAAFPAVMVTQPSNSHIPSEQALLSLPTPMTPQFWQERDDKVKQPSSRNSVALTRVSPGTTGLPQLPPEHPNDAITISRRASKALYESPQLKSAALVHGSPGHTVASETLKLSGHSNNQTKHGRSQSDGQAYASTNGTSSHVPHGSGRQASVPYPVANGREERHHSAALLQPYEDRPGDNVDPTRNDGIQKVSDGVPDGLRHAVGNAGYVIESGGRYASAPPVENGTHASKSLETAKPSVFQIPGYSPRSSPLVNSGQALSDREGKREAKNHSDSGPPPARSAFANGLEQRRISIEHTKSSIREETSVGQTGPRQPSQEPMWTGIPTPEPSPAFTQRMDSKILPSAENTLRASPTPLRRDSSLMQDPRLTQDPPGESAAYRHTQVPVHSSKVDIRPDGYENRRTQETHAAPNFRQNQPKTELQADYLLSTTIQAQQGINDEGTLPEPSARHPVILRSSQQNVLKNPTQEGRAREGLTKINEMENLVAPAQVTGPALTMPLPSQMDLAFSSSRGPGVASSTSQRAYNSRGLTTPSIRHVGLAQQANENRFDAASMKHVNSSTYGSRTTATPVVRMDSLPADPPASQATFGNSSAGANVERGHVPKVEATSKAMPSISDRREVVSALDNDARMDTRGVTDKPPAETAGRSKDFASVLHRKLSHLIGPSTKTEVQSQIPMASDQLPAPSRSLFTSQHASVSASQQARANRNQSHPPLHEKGSFEGTREPHSATFASEQRVEHQASTIKQDPPTSKYEADGTAMGVSGAQDKRSDLTSGGINETVNIAQKSHRHPPHNPSTFTKTSSASAAAHRVPGRVTSSDYYGSMHSRLQNSASGQAHRGSTQYMHRHSQSVPTVVPLASALPQETSNHGSRQPNVIPDSSPTRTSSIPLPSASHITVYQVNQEDETILMTPSSLAGTLPPLVSQQTFSRSVEQVNETDPTTPQLHSDKQSARSKHHAWRLRENGRQTDDRPKKHALQIDTGEGNHTGRDVPIHGGPDGRPIDPRLFNPFRYLATRRRRTVSLLSLEAQDGTATNTVVGSPTASILSSTAPFQIPDERDPVEAAEKWRDQEEAGAHASTKRRPRPGVVFAVKDDPNEEHKPRPRRISASGNARSSSSSNAPREAANGAR